MQEKFGIVYQHYANKMAKKPLKTEEEVKSKLESKKNLGNLYRAIQKYLTSKKEISLYDKHKLINICIIGVLNGSNT